MAEAPRFHARRSGQTFGRYEGYHPKLGIWDHIASRRNPFCLSGVRAPLEATTRLRSRTSGVHGRLNLAAYDQPDFLPVLYCEPYSDNEAAIQRALRLRDEPNFASAWILEEGENVIWNSSELLLECQRRNPAEQRPRRRPR